MLHSRLSRFTALAFIAAFFAACSGGSHPSGSAAALPPMSAPESKGTVQVFSPASVLATLKHESELGSTIDPKNGDLNPYGLDVAKISSGHISAGDLVVCNFNNNQNVQGTGTSIVALHPVAPATPRDIAINSVLNGCNALAMSPAGTIWAAAFSANDNPIVSQSGAVLSALSNGPWHHPFGQAFVPPVNADSVPAFYASNAADGSLVRIYVNPGPKFTFSTIAHGFPVNGGAPGGILAPSGLNYQPIGDRLYVVDGTNNALYAIDNISKIEANGITVNANGTFSGKFAGNAHLLFEGAPLNGPISSAILPGGNIVLGNTLDPDGTNLMVEFSPTGQMLATKNVDNGTAGAIFGMVATGTSAATAKLYFNDDNANSVAVLTH